MVGARALRALVRALDVRQNIAAGMPMPMQTCEGLAERSGPGGCAVTVPAGYVADRGVMLAMIVASMPWFGPTKYKKYQKKKCMRQR